MAKKQAQEKLYTWRFSKSTLEIYQECRRCFWLHMTHKIQWPDGIFPSITFGLDRAMKDWMDAYRSSMPPALMEHIPGTLYGSSEQIKKWRHWASGLRPLIPTAYGTIELLMALDDCVLTPEFQYASLDGKSIGSPPKPTYSQDYYQLQADLYHLGFKLSGMPPAPKAYFLYAWPELAQKTLNDSRLTIGFNFQVQALTANPDEGLRIITEAAKLLHDYPADQGGPVFDAECEQCRYYSKRLMQGSVVPMATQQAAPEPAAIMADL